ncbi:sugar transferase [Actinomyces sp. B33]|uniref:sugar transferase n=1 Tax=Actinomyces sp. B33 TaxID=2942131 RepID=UPI00234136D4|nr:sugar transferase [Actinomyces sp. B33]MDC4233628.1 sugar transferase [Actinomyces sp. B33]
MPTRSRTERTETLLPRNPRVRLHSVPWPGYRSVRAARLLLLDLAAALVPAMVLLAATRSLPDALAGLGASTALVVLLQFSPTRRRGLLDDGNAVAGIPLAIASVVALALVAAGARIGFDARPPLTALAASLVAVLVLQSLAASSLRRDRLSGRALRRTLIILGSGFERILLGLRRRPETGLLIIGYFSSGFGRRSASDPEAVASPAQIRRAIDEEGIDVVATIGAVTPEDLTTVLRGIEGTGARMLVLPGLKDVTAERVRALPVVGGWTASLEVRARRTRLALKSLVDSVLGPVLLVLASPVIAVAALAIRIESPGPAFYRQTRIGLEGRPFTLWKLRSMCQEADALRSAVVARGGDSGNQVLFKDSRDPRITRVGAFIRRFSIDELPQLINVVRGEMSLIGPRPALPDEVAEYDAEARRRLLVKPGLTGLWQVSGRSSLSWESTVALDQHYVDNRGARLDGKIIVRTVKAVLGGEGAY